MSGCDTHIAVSGTRGIPLAQETLSNVSKEAAISPIGTALLHCFLEQGRDWLSAAKYFAVFFCAALLESKPFSAKTAEELFDLFEVELEDVSETAKAERELGSLFEQFSVFLGEWVDALSSAFPGISDAVLAEMCARETARKLAAAKLSAAWLLSSFDDVQNDIEIIGIAEVSEDWLPTSLITVPKNSLPRFKSSEPYAGDAQEDSLLLSMLTLQSYAWTNRSWGKAKRAAEALIEHACGWVWFISSNAGDGLDPSVRIDQQINEGASKIASLSQAETTEISTLVSMPEFQELVSLSAQRGKARSWEEMFSVAEAYAQGLPSYGPNVLGALVDRLAEEAACSSNYPTVRDAAVFEASEHLKEGLAREFARLKSYWKRSMKTDPHVGELVADGAWVSWFDGDEVAFDVELEEPI